ncbi:MAG: hypothetical protein RLZZ15_1041, partial [Verrucomicrobiota bacterium]
MCMHLVARFAFRTFRVHGAGLALLALLHRAPVARLAAAVNAPAVAAVRTALAACASLGALHTLAGATQYVSSPAGTLNATVGTPASAAFALTGTPVPPNSWRVTGSLPPGLTISGRAGPTPINLNAVSLTLSGTPTVAGTYSLTFQAWEYAGQVGISPGTFGYTIVVAGGTGGSGGTGSTVPPAIASSPQGQTVTVGGSVTFSVVASGTPAPALQWRKDGANLPGATASALVLGNAQLADAGNYTVVATNSAGTATSAVATLTVTPANVAPFVLAPPADRTVTAGGSVTFSVVANGFPAPTHPWRNDGAPIAGAVGSTLTLGNVQAADAGAYIVVASNSAGTVSSAPATLTVNPAPAVPLITLHPLSHTVSPGEFVTLKAEAVGVPAPRLQWKKDGAEIPGATAAALTLSEITGAHAGSYTFTATNSTGTVTSTAATLTVEALNPGRLINLSIFTQVTARDPSFTVGVVVGGAGTVGAKPLLIRAVGPTLAAFGVAGVLADPKLEVLADTAIVAANDNWGDTPALTALAAQVGAFAFGPAGSRDAALGFAPEVAAQARAFGVRVSGGDGTTGAVIAELYDATPATAFRAATPRLVNVSVLKQIDAGDSLAAGFVVGGKTSRPVLVRAV